VSDKRKVHVFARYSKTSAAYEACKPKQLGDLHERMKYVLWLLNLKLNLELSGSAIKEEREKWAAAANWLMYFDPSEEDAPAVVDAQLRHAIYDLETEVKYYESFRRR
jgi:hypothetical protein